MKPTSATKVTLITVCKCKWARPQYTIDCFADTSTREACTVTQKLDLDQTSERSIRTRKDTNIIKLTFLVANFGFIRFIWPWLDDSDDVCDLKWRVKCPSSFRPSPWIIPPLEASHRFRAKSSRLNTATSHALKRLKWKSFRLRFQLHKSFVDVILIVQTGCIGNYCCWVYGNNSDVYIAAVWQG